MTCARCSNPCALPCPGCRLVSYCCPGCLDAHRPEHQGFCTCAPLIKNHTHLWALQALKTVVAIPAMAEFMRREGFATLRAQCATLRDFTNMALLALHAPFGKAFIRHLDVSTDEQFMGFYEENARGDRPAFVIFQYAIYRMNATIAFPRRLWSASYQVAMRRGLEQMIYEKAVSIMLGLLTLLPQPVGDLRVLIRLFNTFPDSVVLAKAVDYIYGDSKLLGRYIARARRLAKRPMPVVLREVPFV